MNRYGLRHGCHLWCPRAVPVPQGNPSLGLGPEPPSLLQEHCCYQGTVEGVSGSWASVCACTGLR